MSKKIIVLNGVSSAGKTSIANELVQLFNKDEACLMSYDYFMEDYFRSLGSRISAYTDVTPMNLSRVASISCPV